MPDHRVHGRGTSRPHAHGPVGEAVLLGVLPLEHVLVSGLDVPGAGAGDAGQVRPAAAGGLGAVEDAQARWVFHLRIVAEIAMSSVCRR